MRTIIFLMLCLAVPAFAGESVCLQPAPSVNGVCPGYLLYQSNATSTPHLVANPATGVQTLVYSSIYDGAANIIPLDASMGGHTAALITRNAAGKLIIAYMSLGEARTKFEALP